MTLNQFIKENRSDMLENLTDIVSDLKSQIEVNPEEYTEYGTDEPSIDIRLCIDLTKSDPNAPLTPFFTNYSGRDGTWIFRTGLVDYDQRHSLYSAASSVQLDTNPEVLLNDLINQIFE